MIGNPPMAARNVNVIALIDNLGVRETAAKVRLQLRHCLTGAGREVRRVTIKVIRVRNAADKAITLGGSSARCEVGWDCPGVELGGVIWVSSRESHPTGQNPSDLPAQS